ncbi:secretin N-terminal domain-containing protein [Sulfuricurvum sp.]|uniref:secretin N-terminal domain-containing protein n=1 Tax=Sulfuricurvum sp. TaxID=2025608 RepID=UPI003BB7724A
MIRFVLSICLSISLFGAVPALKPPVSVPLASVPMLPPPPLVSTLNNMSLIEFLRMASNSMKKNIILTDDITGSIDYLSNQNITGRDLLPLVKTALEINGYGLVDKGRFYYVVPAKDLKNHRGGSLGSRDSSLYASKVIKIKYSNVVQILEGVNSLLSASGSAFGVASSQSLVVSDFPENIKLIEHLINQIDIAPLPINQSFKSFRLVNSSASSVLSTLKSIYSGDNNHTSISFSINEESNTLFASGDPKLLDRLPSFISDLDREQFQVYIQFRIIELNNDLSSKIGIKYGIDGGIVSSSNFFTFAGNLGGSSSPTVNALVTSSLGSSLGNVNQLLTIGAALDLLKSEGVSKTISDPSILCLNNKESKIVVGKSLSFLKGSTTGAAGTTNSLDRSDVGLNLTIKPLVASKDKLTLTLDAVLENVLPSVDSNNQPVTSKQQIKTDSILHHGETIVLGGFVKSYETNNKSSVPFLSDLPYIGSVFDHKTAVNQSDTLLLVITPYIVDDSRSLSSLQSDLGKLGQLQKIYNESLD